MQPLDLTKQRPRGCTDDSLGGIVFLARTIDKARGELPGGNPGVYFTVKDGTKTLSGGLFRVLKVEADEFRRVVAEAPDDAAVTTWVLERAPSDRIAMWNERVLGLSLGDLDPEGRESFHRNNPGTDQFPDSTQLVLLIDTWDDGYWSASVR